MNNPLGLSKTNLNDIFLDVNTLYRDNVEEVISEHVLRGLKKLFENALKAEVLGYVKARWYKRSKIRVDSRNGFRYRNLTTAFGVVRVIQVPRTRRKGYQFKLFERYQRRWRKVDQFIREIFIGGVSTRNVGWVMRSLVGKTVSASTVSSVCKVLDHEVGQFHRQPLADDYVYLFLDGVRQRLVSCGRAVKKLVLVAYGIKTNGQRVVIDFWLAKSESEHDWTVFLNSLYQRGLAGKNLRLIITDGAPGLLKALDMWYPHVERQRCWVHKEQNVAKYIPRRYQKECLGELKQIYLASSYRAGVKRYQRWCRKWRDLVPKAVQCLEKDIEELLVFYRQDKKLWVKIRTTNAIERLFKELRRRTRPMNLFANEESCQRIVYALFAKYNKKWEDRRYAIF
jgi:putative transposase